MVLDRLVVGAGEIARRRLEVENRVEHELQLRAARAEHGVEAGRRRGERRLRLRLHHPHRHQQPAGERDATGRDDGGERVLAQAAMTDDEERASVIVAAPSP